MGWKDGCHACGGHTNSEGVLLHKLGCTAEGSPSKSFMDRLQEGLLLSAVIVEARFLMRPETGDKWDATRSLVERAMDIVEYRYKGIETPKEMRARIIIAAMKELEHGL